MPHSRVRLLSRFVGAFSFACTLLAQSSDSDAIIVGAWTCSGSEFSGPEWGHGGSQSDITIHFEFRSDHGVSSPDWRRDSGIWSGSPDDLSVTFKGPARYYCDATLRGKIANGSLAAKVVCGDLTRRQETLTPVSPDAFESVFACERQGGSPPERAAPGVPAKAAGPKALAPTKLSAAGEALGMLIDPFAAPTKPAAKATKPPNAQKMTAAPETTGKSSGEQALQAIVDPFSKSPTAPKKEEEGPRPPWSLKFLNISTGPLDIEVFESNSPSCGGAIGNQERQLAAAHLESGDSIVVGCQRDVVNSMCYLWKRSDESWPSTTTGNVHGVFCTEEMNRQKVVHIP